MRVVQRLLTVLLMTGLAAMAAAAPRNHVTVQLNWLPEPEFGGIYAAERLGVFARHGLDVEILKGGPDVPALQMAAAGRVTFALAAADEVVSLREKGAAVVALYATFQTNPQGIMVKAARPVTSIPALLAAGGTLIAQPGLAYLKWLARKYDMTKIRIAPYEAGAWALFLDPRRLDVAMQCFVTAEPITARRRGVEPRVFLVAETGFDPYAGVVVTRTATLQDRRDLCRRFVAALREGWRAYLADPGPTNAAMARMNTAMDLATFAAAAQAQRPLIESADTRAKGLGAMSLARWAVLVKQLLALAVIETPVAARTCFTNL
jgi:NitT/TauT family transport system substrate-binding protein